MVSAKVAVVCSITIVVTVVFSVLGIAKVVDDLTYDKGGVLVQLFEWKWNDVALECEQFLGPKVCMLVNPLHILFDCVVSMCPCGQSI